MHNQLHRILISITTLTPITTFAQTNPIDTSTKPTIFAAGVVSTPFEEVAATFTPDGNTVFFAQGTISMEICFSKRSPDNTWTKPQVISFSGRWGDWDPFLSPDGARIYFVSNRPLDTTGENKFKRQTHLWFSNHERGDKWAEPQYIKDSFNLDGIGNFAPTVSRSGDLFFYSPRRGKAKSYYVQQKGDHYGDPQPLLLNGEEEVSDPLIAPDGSYIIFVSGNDLYISYRQKGDTWTKGLPLGLAANDGSSIYDPTLSPDGKTLYFTSNRIAGYYKRDPKNLPLDYEGLLKEMNGIFNGKGNIFMVPLHIPLTGS